MAADPRASASMADAFSQALLDGALPGETEGFTPAEQAEAAAFIAEVAAERRPGEIALKLQSVGGESARRLIRSAMAGSLTPEAIAERVEGGQEAREVYAASALLSGRDHPGEALHLDRLARALGLTEDEARGIEASLHHV